MNLNHLIALAFALALGFCHVDSGVSAAESAKPNMLIIIADDLGWTDVGYHGSEIKTPNIDRLKSEGVELNQFYVQPVCTPTRACLMTGRYPLRLGLQVGVVRPWARYGLALDERMLSQALKDAGYETAITGKWHLGHFKRDYLPTRRGFDHQYGHYNGAIDYYTHIRDFGLDWHRDDKGLDEEGYSTNLLADEAIRLMEHRDKSKPLFLYVPFNAVHAPLQAPKEYLEKYASIADEKRRTYAAMTTCMDDAIGRIVAALDKNGMRENTLVFFSSDNGGPLVQGATNGPLRGAKGTLYEGGVRVVAFARWPGRIKPGSVVNHPLHMTDMYPTLIKLAGASLEQEKPIDGLDVWPTIAEGKPTAREEFVINIQPSRAAIRRGDWKLVINGGKADESRPAEREELELFNIANDPYEKTNLVEREPDRVKELYARIEHYRSEAVPPRFGKNGGRRLSPEETPKVWGDEELSNE